MPGLPRNKRKKPPTKAAKVAETKKPAAAKAGTLKRKRELRSSLKNKLTDKSVLDCTPLKGLKPAASGLAFLDELSPMSFGTPAQKKTRKKKGGTNVASILPMLSPTNRNEADRYILELYRRQKTADVQDLIPKPGSSKAKVSNLPESEQECSMNLSAVFAKNNNSDSDYEGEKDYYFD